VVNLLSLPVVNGFTNAAAIIIATSQFPKLLGVYIDSGEHHYETMLRLVHAAAQYTHWPTLLMGVCAFVIMYGFKWIFPRFPTLMNSRSMGYIWDSKAPVGSLGTSTAYSKMKYIVLQSGASKLGQWVSETRNVYEDYKKAFGAELR
jgi:MFS superfamily sulfate permease-like transporter